MILDIHSVNGSKTGRTIELPDTIFGIEPNEHTVYLAVKQYLAHQRQGTHKSKERSELSGSTRKLFKQKGTGGARRGDINSPLLYGGARVFGPKPHDYVIKLNKKVIGSITDEEWKIRLMVMKDDINSDGNPNCTWKWITLNKRSKSLQEAKDWLNEHADSLLKSWGKI